MRLTKLMPFPCSILADARQCCAALVWKDVKAKLKKEAGCNIETWVAVMVAEEGVAVEAFLGI